MLRTLAVLGVLLPALALAQVTVTESSDVENGDDEIINIAECEGAPGTNSRFSVTWRTATTAISAQVDLRISDTVNCPLPNNNTSTNAVTKSLGVFTGTSGSLPSAQSANNLVTLLGLKCDAGNLRSINVCAVTTSGGLDVANSSQSAVIQLDLAKPSPPSNVRVTPGDGALDVSWDASSSATRYRVEATPAAGGNVERSSETTDTSKRISRLTNGTDYNVVVVGLSIGGNPSDPSSPPVVGRPVEILDFWRHYQQTPGANEEGGCATAGSGGVALLALVPLLARAGRRRRS